MNNRSRLTALVGAEHLSSKYLVSSEENIDPARSLWVQAQRAIMGLGIAAMIALAGIWRRFHFTQKCIHLFGLHATPSAHGMMARKCRKHMVKPVFKRKRCAPILQTVDKIAHQCCDIAIRQRRWHFRYCNRAIPKRLS